MHAAPERLKNRGEFLRVARTGRKWVAPGLILQIGPHMDEMTPSGHHVADHPAPPGSAGAFRVGYTVSRKVGGAVVRNRVRRRLRAAVERVMPGHAAAQHDYVVIGRAASVRRPFDALSADLETALKRLGAWRDGDDDGGGGGGADGANTRREGS